MDEMDGELKEMGRWLREVRKKIWHQNDEVELDEGGMMRDSSVGWNLIAPPTLRKMHLMVVEEGFVMCGEVKRTRLKRNKIW